MIIIKILLYIQYEVCQQDHLIQFDQNIAKLLPLPKHMAERKSSVLKKSKQGFIDQSDQQGSSFKNENVIFKIHTPRGQQNYNGKHFPAKFSINIRNEPVEMSSPYFMARDSTKPSLINEEYGNTSEVEYQHLKTDRSSGGFDNKRNSKQIKVALDDKRKHDMLIRQLERTCLDYEKKNLELASLVQELNNKLKWQSQKLNGKQKKQLQAIQMLSKIVNENKELKSKIINIEAEYRKQTQRLERDSQLKQQIRNLEIKIFSLESLVAEKEQTIKNISNFNNQIAHSVIKDKSLRSISELKQIEKWFKALSRRNENVNYDIKCNKSSNNEVQNFQLSKLIQKHQGMLIKIIELQNLNQQLGSELKKCLRQNQNQTIVNEQLRRLIQQLQQAIEKKEAMKQNQQASFKKPFSNNNRNDNCAETGIFIYEGTVKVKMQSLLLEKDKRINSLQCQLMDVKRQNTVLKTKIYSLNSTQSLTQPQIPDLNLKKVRSLSNFFSCKEQKPFTSQGKIPTQNSGGEIYKDLLSQCNTLTETLGNFMGVCKTDRVGASYPEYLKEQRCQQSFEPISHFAENPSQKMIKTSRINQRLHKRNRRQPSTGEFENMRWNCNKQNPTREQSVIFPVEEDKEIPRFEYRQQRDQSRQRSYY